jgi:PHP family Zn ribbon phosphoesterase
MRVRADLHIHTGLSPCASEEMTPPDIVSEAIRKGLRMIAICDHNSAGNVQAVMQAAADALTKAAPTAPEATAVKDVSSASRRDDELIEGEGNRRVPELQESARTQGVRGLSVIPGIEITTSEEVHVLGLFPDVSSAKNAAAEVLDTLPFDESGEQPQGQFLLDAEGRVVGREPKMLFSASAFSLSDAVALVRRHGGLTVASHVDRPSFSVIGQLGVFPDDVRFDALEISAAGHSRGRHRDFLSAGLPLVCSSDSHYLDDIGSGCTMLEVAEPTFEELRLAFLNDGERRCWLA